MYFGVSPSAGRSVRIRARQRSRLTRLSAVVRPRRQAGGCMSLDVAKAIVAKLLSALHSSARRHVPTRPTIFVYSGHGLHAYWPISDGTSSGDALRRGHSFAAGDASSSRLPRTQRRRRQCLRPAADAADTGVAQQQRRQGNGAIGRSSPPNARPVTAHHRRGRRLPRPRRYHRIPEDRTAAGTQPFRHRPIGSGLRARAAT